jgi:hypothetical protein
VGLRDRALLGLMVFTFARVSAPVGVNVGDLGILELVGTNELPHAKLA